MSNTRIVERLSALADGIELGQVSVEDFRDELLGHTGALERMPYDLVVEARQVWAQLTKAIDSGQAALVNVHALGDWLRTWTKQVPSDPPSSKH